jgi:RNA polymerase sigma-70 factor (ECF subfamily)
LVALMALQAARMPARVDAAGDLVLLEDQDPDRWDGQLIGLGFHHFDQSIAGREVSRYHVEAAIAATHASQPVDWSRILELYDQLLALDTASPVVQLNRAVAVARVAGPEAGLRVLEPLMNHAKLRDYHLLMAARAHFLLETGCLAEAAEAFRGALGCPCSAPERRFLERKLAVTLERQLTTASRR